MLGPSDDADISAAGLLMNPTNGTERTGDVEPGNGTENLLALDPTEWHEFWISIVPGGTGTHQATLFVDGDDNIGNAITFDLTAGSGTEEFGGEDVDSVLSMGSSNTNVEGAVDIDFIAFFPAPLLPNLVAGDVDGDKDVDKDDLTIIRDNYFETVAGGEAGRLLGDLTGDLIVDFQDYRQWTDHFPTLAPPISASGAVPEPTSLGLALLGGGTLFGIRRGSRSR